MNNTKSQPFDVITSKPVPTTETLLLWSYKVPPNALLKILKMGNTLGEPEAWGSIYWTIKRNGIAITEPYDKLYDQIGYGADLKVVSIDDFQGTDLIEVYATNNYVDVVDVGLLLKVEVY